MNIKVYTLSLNYLFTVNIRGDYIPLLANQDKVLWFYPKTEEVCMYWKDYKNFVDAALEI